jgi:hypothetical protein
MLIVTVTTKTPGGCAVWYLRNTIWTGDVTRATRYEKAEDARAAIAKAATFNKKAAKAALIVEAPKPATMTHHDYSFMVNARLEADGEPPVQTAGEREIVQTEWEAGVSAGMCALSIMDVRELDRAKEAARKGRTI